MKRKIYKMCFAVIITQIVVVGLTACGQKSYFESVNKEESKQTESDESSKNQTAGDTYYVEISGAVNCPGVYKLKSGSRVCDLIDKAGGLAENADTNSLNQAAKLTDEQKIIVMTTAQTEALAKQEAENSLVNLNTASEEQLMELTGIGETRAQAVIQYREEHGGFQKIEDIMNVSGIKEGAFNKIKNDITVN